MVGLKIEDDHIYIIKLFKWRELELSYIKEVKTGILRVRILIHDGNEFKQYVIGAISKSDAQEIALRLKQAINNQKKQPIYNALP